MRCTGDHCERRNECARYYMKAPADGKIHTLESLYYFGSGSIRSDGTSEEHYLCGPLGNWGMFVPIEKTNADHIRSMTDEELATLLLDGCRGSKCDDQPQNEYGSVNCFQCRMGWLKQPYKEEP